MSAPDPLTPHDCDLRGLEYMPLLGGHLFGSEFNARANDSEWRAAVTLWWAAWQQVPAASLPDDDVALCRFADLGRDVKGWRKLRDRALHGWIRCDDGRLYHPTLAKQALIAWDKRVKERERKAAWRAKKDAEEHGRDTGQNADVPRDTPPKGRGQGQGQDSQVPADGTRRDGTGRDNEEESGDKLHSLAREPFPRPDGVDPQVWRDFLANRKRKNLANTATAHKRLLDDLGRLATDEWPPGRLLEHAAAKGWGGVYDPEEQRNGQRTQHHEIGGASDVGRTVAARDRILARLGSGTRPG